MLIVCILQFIQFEWVFQLFHCFHSCNMDQRSCKLPHPQLLLFSFCNSQASKPILGCHLVVIALCLMRSKDTPRSCQCLGSYLIFLVNSSSNILENLEIKEPQLPIFEEEAYVICKKYCLLMHTSFSLYMESPRRCQDLKLDVCPLLQGLGFWKQRKLLVSITVLHLSLASAVVAITAPTTWPPFVLVTQLQDYGAKNLVSSCRDKRYVCNMSNNIKVLHYHVVLKVSW